MKDDFTDIKRILESEKKAGALEEEDYKSALLLLQGQEDFLKKINIKICTITILFQKYKN